MAFNYIPQAYYDLYLNYGADLQLNATATPAGNIWDLSLVDGSFLSNQRIQRRLLTNPLDYIWVPSYGAGLPQYIGQPLSDDNFDNIKAQIISQIFMESTVNQNPPPDILIQTIQYGIFVQINYNLSPSLQPVILTLDVGAT